MSEEDLQKQCQDLLHKLRKNQATLRQVLTSDKQSSVLKNNLQDIIVDPKPEYARQKLKSIMKHNCKNNQANNSSIIKNAVKNDSQKSRLTQGTFINQTLKNKITEQDSTCDNKLAEHEEEINTVQKYFKSRTTDSLLEGGSSSFDSASLPTSVGQSNTPVAVRKRRIIDKNVRVDSKLSDTELLELEADNRRLNFSYSQCLEDNETNLKSTENKEKDCNQEEVCCETYKCHLGDDGNNRKLNQFIKETTIKPKSRLNATLPTHVSRNQHETGNNSQITNSSSGSNSLFRSQAGDRRLLGYDWIAALIDNDQGLINESESYFHELREFRRCNRDECCNDFYMEGPFTMAQRDPPAVDKALNEQKVQPFTVNERLFTVPVKEKYLEESLIHELPEKDVPTQENPRFVRVSIPRSTLLTPYKSRPHRRRSFDSSDTCSLMDHCLMGWNPISPASLPTASSVALSDSLKGLDKKHSTTMAEAERVASTFHWPLLPETRTMVEPLKNWHRNYMDTAVNFPQPDRSFLSSSLGSRGKQDISDLRQKTDDLLNTTYSMMYEMQRAREAREDESRKQFAETAA